MSVQGSQQFAIGIPGTIFTIPGLLEVRRYRRRSATSGIKWVVVCEGTPAAVQQAFLECPAGFDAECEEEGPIHRITVTTPDDPTGTTFADPVNTYELLGNEAQKDIREHPVALALGPEKIEIIDDVLEKNGEHNASDIVAGTMTTLYNSLLQRKGNMAYQTSQFVLSLTTVVSKASDYPVAYRNLNKLYTFAQLRTEANPPSGIILSIDQIESQCAPSSIPDGYVWRWLKKSPQVRTAPGNKIAIGLEYVLEVWESWVYDAATL